MNDKYLNKSITFIIILFLILYSTSGCLDNGNDEKSEFEQKIDQINSKAVKWLETLDVDPIKLRYDLGLKGKKKFVELLDSYLVLYQTEEDQNKKAEYLNKVQMLTNVTNEIKYHDLSVINDTIFKQDSTSYLRAWYIMSKFGLNTSYYDDEIYKVIPRINTHLPTRGINQKMVFVFYYQELGYPIVYTVEELFNLSEIRKGVPKEKLDNLTLYYITHEVFVLHDINNTELLTSDDLRYLNDIIPYHINRTIAENNVDLLAELIMIMTYLGFHEMAVYKTGLEYLLANQNPNGSFGYYEGYRKVYADLGISVDIQLYLHTTEVTLRALNEAIDVFGVDE